MNENPKHIGEIITNLALKVEAPKTLVPLKVISKYAQAPAIPSGGYFDFDLAEFPCFSLSSNPKNHNKEPLQYRDFIKGANGQSVERIWTVYPSPLGFGSATTMCLLYDFLNLYVEQGASSHMIKFGTMRSLLLRRGNRHPSQADYERLRRDITILRGLDFHSKNASWNSKSKAYVDAEWRLFGEVFYFKSTPDDGEADVPYGFITVSPMFQKMARNRGFYATSIPPQVFHSLSPLEQRLALYLSKKFLFQAIHRRYFDELARALPIHAENPANARTTLKRGVERLLGRKLPFLAGFELKRNHAGRWVASFFRGQMPKERGIRAKENEVALSSQMQYQLEQIYEALGNSDDRVWWTECVRRLGPDSVARALGQLKEARRIQVVKNPGGMLTKILKDIAAERGISLR